MDTKIRIFWQKCRTHSLKLYRSLTNDFDYSSDQFFGLDFLMVAGGARFLSTNVKLYRCWNIYRWLIQLPILLVLWNTFLHIYQQSKLEVILSCLQAAVCGVSINVRIVAILRNYEQLVQARKFLNQRYFGRDLERAWNIRCESFYRSRKTVIFAVGLLMSFCLCFFALDLANHHATKFPGEEIRRYPVVLNIMETALCLSLFGVSLKILCVTLAIPIILNGLKSEINVITVVFSNTFENFKMQTSLEECQQQKKDFWKKIQENINECVELHTEFLAALDHVRPLLNATFLVLYYSAALSLASGAIYVSQMKTVTLFAFQVLFYVFWVAFECYFVTKNMDELADDYESLSSQIYDMDWPTMLQFDDQFNMQYRSIRKTMAILMAVAQQPLRLNCFGLFEFNQEQFYNLLNMTYSLYTFFRDFV